MCYNISAYVGGARFELAWHLADGCQDRYVSQFHHPPTTENWGECSTKMLLALNPLNLILAGFSILSSANMCRVIIAKKTILYYTGLDWTIIARSIAVKGGIL